MSSRNVYKKSKGKRICMEAGICFAHGEKVDIPIMTCSYGECKEIARLGNTCELHANKGIPGSILSPNLIMVEGCGMADVNGIYQRDGKLAIYSHRNNKIYSVYKYTKKAIYSGESTTAIHNGEEVVFALYRREFGWQISILDTEHDLDCCMSSTVTFYAHELLVHYMEECIEYEADGETPTPGVQPWFEKSSKSVYDNDKYPLTAEARVPPRDSWEVKGSGIGPPPRVYLTPKDVPSIDDYREQTTGASYKLYYLSKYGEKSQIPSNKVIITALKACGIPPSIFKSNETTHVSLVAQLLKLVKQTMKTLKPDIQWRESEVLMNIKSNNLQIYNCIVRHEAIYASKEKQQFGSQYQIEQHKFKDDNCGNDYFIGVDPTSDECLFTNKSYPSIINKGFVWSVIIPYQGKLRRFGQYSKKEEALKARYAALKVLMSCPNSNLNKQQIDENVKLARDAVAAALDISVMSIAYRGYRGSNGFCKCQVAAATEITRTNPIIQNIISDLNRKKAQTENDCSDYQEPVSKSVKKNGKSTDYTGRRHHYKSVGGSIRKSDQIAGVDIHRKMERLKHSLMKKAVRYIEKHDPEEDGSLRKELDELIKKSGSSGKKPAKVIPDILDIDRIVKKHGVHAAAAALRTQKVKIGRIKKRKLAK